MKSKVYEITAVFGITAAILGPWLERNGPFKGAILGASLFYLGNLLTALGVYVKSFGLIYFGYGFIGGAGLGISYISPVSPLQKWFPELRGLAAGLAVCGFGAGSIFSPYTQKALIGVTYATTGVANVGLPLTFVILGSAYFVIMSLCALVLRMPPPGYEVKGIRIETVKGAEKYKLDKTGNDDFDPFAMTLIESLTSKEFILTYFMFMFNELTGLLIISKIQSIVQNQLGKSANYAADINSALGGMNLLGRLIVPLTSDFVKQRKPFFLLSLAVQAVMLGLLPGSINSQNTSLTLACAFLIAFFYGAGFGIIPAFLSDQFSSKNCGATHGMILTSWSFAGVVGGLVFTAVYNQQKTLLTETMGKETALLYMYNINFQWILAFVILGFVICCFIPANIIDRKLPKVDGEWFRFRFINNRVVRVIGGRPVMISREQEMNEWNAYLDLLRKERQIEMKTPSPTSSPPVILQVEHVE
jgi:MFS family permease